MSELRLSIMTEDFLPTQAISCGVDSIDEQIQEAYSRTLFKQGTAYNIYVDKHLVGSCMLKLVRLYDEEKDAEYYVSAPEFIAIELTHIAIDKRLQGRGLGTEALKQLLSTIKGWAKELPIRFFVLDALADKEDWYQKAGFKKYPKQADFVHPNTIPMRIDLIDLKAAEEYCDTL